MKLINMIVVTPKAVINRSKSVKYRLHTSGERTLTDKDGYMFSFSAKDTKGSGRLHKQLVWFDVPKVTPKLVPNAKVYCSCEFFNFYLAYALNKRDACVPMKDINYAMNTKAPITNHFNKNYLCKHLYKVMEHFKKLKKNRL